MSRKEVADAYGYAGALHNRAARSGTGDYTTNLDEWTAVRDAYLVAEDAALEAGADDIAVVARGAARSIEVMMAHLQRGGSPVVPRFRDRDAPRAPKPRTLNEIATRHDRELKGLSASDFRVRAARAMQYKNRATNLLPALLFGRAALTDKELRYLVRRHPELYGRLAHIIGTRRPPTSTLELEIGA